MSSGMRIGGIASGFDTETTISKLMEAEKVKYNKFYQTKQTNIWKRDAYNSFNKDMANFINASSSDWGITRSNYGQIYESSRNNMTWLKRSVVSDSTVATATVGAGAVSGKYSLDVKNLAEGVNVFSQASLKDTDIADADGKLKISGEFKIEIDIPKDGGGTETVSSNISYTTADTLQTIATKINAAKYTKNGKDISMNLSAMYDSNSGRLFVSSKSTGKDINVKMTDTTSNLVTKMNLQGKQYVEGTGYVTKNITDGIVGRDSKVEINGASIDYSTNQFVFNNMTISMNKVGTTDIDVSVNVDDAYKKIKEFVDNYNKIVDSVNKKTTEKAYRDYKPLLEDQRKSMNEEDVKLWEEKAKSGLLKGDSLLTGVGAGVRSWIYEKVEGASGAYSAAYEIGIETTSNYKEPGKLQINEKKLREALASDSDSVMDVLFKNASGISKDEKDMTSTEITDKRKQSGLINRIYDEMIVGMKKIVTKAGAGEDSNLLRSVQATILLEFTTRGAYGKGNESILDKDITGIEKLMTIELDRLESRETSYWNRFTAMEKAISNMNAQSSWIGSQMMK